MVRDSFSGASRFRQFSQVNIFTDGSRVHAARGPVTSSTRVPQSMTLPRSPCLPTPRCSRRKWWPFSWPSVMCSVRRALFALATLRSSAIPALDARRSTCRTVRDAIDALNALANVCHTVRLIWVPSHTGIQGNDRADLLAKSGTLITSPESPYLPLLSLIHI